MFSLKTKAEFRGTPQLSCPALPLSPGPALLLGTLPGHSATRPTPHVCTAECCHSAGDARMDQPSPKPCPSPGRCTPSSTDPQSTATKAQQEPSHSAWQRALSPSSPTQRLHGTEPRPQVPHPPRDAGLPLRDEATLAARDGCCPEGGEEVAARGGPFLIERRKVTRSQIVLFWVGSPAAIRPADRTHSPGAASSAAGLRARCGAG